MVTRIAKIARINDNHHENSFDNAMSKRFISTDKLKVVNRHGRSQERVRKLPSTVIPLFSYVYTNDNYSQLSIIRECITNLEYLIIRELFSVTGGLSTVAIVRVQVTDVNDNRPIFEPRKYNVTVKSDSPIQGAILRLVATDLDAGLFGQVAYRITNGNEAGVFQIDRNTGELQVARPSLLSRSLLHQLNVTATDAAGLKSTFDAEVRITTSSPGHRIAGCEKPRYTVTVKETIPQNSVVAGVKDGAASSSSSGMLVFPCCRRRRYRFPVEERLDRQSLKRLR